MMGYLKRQLDALAGHRTFVLGLLVALAWIVKLIMMDDAEAAEVMSGVSMAALLGGLGALLGASKYGTAQKIKAERTPQ